MFIKLPLVTQPIGRSQLYFHAFRRLPGSGAFSKCPAILSVRARCTEAESPIAPLSQFRQLKSQVQNRVRPTPRLEYFRKPDIAALHSYIDTWLAPPIRGVVALVKAPLRS